MQTFCRRYCGIKISLAGNRKDFASSRGSNTSHENYRLGWLRAISWMCAPLHFEVGWIGRLNIPIFGRAPVHLIIGSISLWVAANPKQIVLTG